MGVGVLEFTPLTDENPTLGLIPPIVIPLRGVRLWRLQHLDFVDIKHSAFLTVLCTH